MNLVVKTRIKLLQQQPFFGRLALLLNIEDAPHIDTLCTDGETLYYNHDYVKKMNEEMRIAAVLHEVLHVALGHLWRRGNRIPHLWNIATDYVVNSLLIKNRLPVPTGGLFNQLYVDKNAEQVYELLKKSAKTLDCGFHVQLDMDAAGGGQGEEKDDQEQEGEGGGQGKNQQDGDEQEEQDGEGSGDGKESKQKKDSKGKGKQKKKNTTGCAVCQAHGLWDKLKANPKKSKRIQRRFEATMEQIARDRGTVPAGFERIIEDLKPQEDWKKILMNYLSTSKNDYDFMRRDRRTLDWDFYLPDLQDEQKLENLVVAIDTSGSIGINELNKFVSEVREILRLFPHTKGWLIDCDAKVNQCIEIEKAREPKLRFYGGGGTSHVPVFQEIKKREIRPKVMLAFTDLWTDFPREKPNYPVLWLATPGEGKREVPFGRTIELKRKLTDGG